MLVAGRSYERPATKVSRDSDRTAVISGLGVPAAVVAGLAVLAAVVAGLVVPTTVVAGLAVLAPVIADSVLAGCEDDAVPTVTSVITGLAVLTSVVAGLAVLAAVVAGLTVFAAVVPNLDVMRSQGAGMCGRSEGGRRHGSGSQRDSSE